MTDAEKRVAIAKDVIAQIQARRYCASHRGYVIMKFHDPVPNTISDLQEIANIPWEQCDVCAKGSLLISKARLYNNVWVDESWVLDDDRKVIGNYEDYYLTDVFEEKQLDLIEACYEGWQQFGPDSTVSPRKFFRKYTDPEERLVAIMENIITNDGEFKP